MMYSRFQNLSLVLPEKEIKHEDVGNGKYIYLDFSLLGGWCCMFCILFILSSSRQRWFTFSVDLRAGCSHSWAFRMSIGNIFVFFSHHFLQWNSISCCSLVCIGPRLGFDYCRVIDCTHRRVRPWKISFCVSCYLPLISHFVAEHSSIAAFYTTRTSSFIPDWDWPFFKPVMKLSGMCGPVFVCVLSAVGGRKHCVQILDIIGVLMHMVFKPGVQIRTGYLMFPC